MANTNVHGYRNTTTGDTYVTGGPRPDLEARPNFEKVDIDQDDVPEALRDQLAGEANTAAVLLESAKTTENQQQHYLEGQPLGTALAEMPAGEPESFVQEPAVSGAAGGVLSRNVVRGMPTAVAQAQAAADSEALALHGVLADQVDNSQERVDADGIAHGVQVENAKPRGETKDSPAAKRAATAKRLTDKDKASRTQTPQSGARPGQPGKPS